MLFESKFYIVEQVNSVNVKEKHDQSQIPLGNKYDYERVWILEQVQNRPYFMRVTYLAQVKKGY